MSTITAVPDAATGTVELTVNAGAGNVNSITRVDANGTRAVRLPSTALLPAPGTYVVRDHEAALSGNIQYRATTSSGPVSTWATLAGGLPRFVIPQLPTVSAGVENVFAYTAPRESRATVHEVPGRPDPIIVQATMGTRRGTLGILCTSHTDVMRLAAIFQRGQTVMYREANNPGMDMYFHPLSLAPVKSGGKWELTVNYAEVSFPSGHVHSDPEWTFAALAATGGTFADVALDFADFTAVKLNERTP